MKISEVISKLQEIQKEHGDIQCGVWVPAEEIQEEYCKVAVRHIDVRADDNNPELLRVIFWD